MCGKERSWQSPALESSKMPLTPKKTLLSNEKITPGRDSWVLVFINQIHSIKSDMIYECE